MTVRATPAFHKVRRRFREVAALGFVVAGRGSTSRATPTCSARWRAWAAIDTALLPVWGWGTSLGAGHMDPPGRGRGGGADRPPHRDADPLGHLLPDAAGRHGHPLLRDPPHDFASLVGDRAPEVRVLVPAIGERVAL